MKAVSLSFLAPLVCISLLACDRETRQDLPTVQPAPPVEFDNLFEPVGQISIEETDDAITVMPRVVPDARGGLLIADQTENQVRRYNSQGRLLAAFGREGRGPGEFHYPTTVVRLRDGCLLVFELEGRVTLLTSDADSVLSVRLTGFHRVEELAVLSDSTVLVSGNTGPPESPRLHVWNVETGQIERSFFRPFGLVQYPLAADIADWTTFDTRGDTVVAAFSLVDSLYFFTTDGELLDTKWIPANTFRHPGPFPEEARRNPRARAEWAGSFDAVSKVDWPEPNRLVVQLQTLVNFVPVFAVALITRDGVPLGQASESPRLLGTSLNGDTLFFIHPETDVPNKWLLVRLAGGLALP